MALRDIKIVQPPELRDIVKELQGLKVVRVNGAAAASKMNVAALRKEDTILSVLTTNDAAAGVSQDDTANVSIVETHATGTLTITGNPVDGETFVVNGVTYTFKATPTLGTHVKITAGNNNAMAASVASVVNAWENRRLTTSKWNTAAVVASPTTNVVTFTAVVDGAAGNAITLTEAVTNVAVSGAGTLTNGNDTGGITSTTNNTSRSVHVLFFDKNY